MPHLIIRRAHLFTIALIVSICLLPRPATAAENLSENLAVNLYAYRTPELLQPLLNRFTADTGVAVNVVYAKSGILERLRAEGANSPADLVLTADIGRLVDLKQAGLTQAVVSPQLVAHIPAHLRDREQHWFGLSARARIIVTANDRVPAAALQTYEQLADPEWRGRICTRAGKHPYMVTLIAAMLAHHGEAAAARWLAGVKANLARKPQGNDRAQVKALVAGDCDIALINHYYLYKMLTTPQQRDWVAAVRVIFPNQADRGTHINVVGVAMCKYAPNAASARQLMEFLASDPAQRIYTEQNGEYAVKPGVPLATAVAQWGDFHRDALPLETIAAHRRAATKLVDRVGYDR